MLTTAQENLKLKVEGYWNLKEVMRTDKENRVFDIKDAGKIGLITEFGIYENDFFFIKGEYGEKGQDITVNSEEIIFHLNGDTIFNVGYTLLEDGMLQLTYTIKIVEDGIAIDRKHCCLYIKR